MYYVKSPALVEVENKYLKHNNNIKEWVKVACVYACIAAIIIANLYICD